MLFRKEVFADVITDFEMRSPCIRVSLKSNDIFVRNRRGGGAEEKAV